MNSVSIINADEIYRMFHYGYVRGFEKNVILESGSENGYDNCNTQLLWPFLYACLQHGVRIRMILFYSIV